MGRKFYMHGTGELRDGKLYCTICGKPLPRNTFKQPFPYTISASKPFDEEISISVWNCYPSVYLNNVSVEERWPLTEEERDKLYDLAVESVEDAGGALNWSGIYVEKRGGCGRIL